MPQLVQVVLEVLLVHPMLAWYNQISGAQFCGLRQSRRLTVVDGFVASLAQTDDEKMARALAAQWEEESNKFPCLKCNKEFHINDLYALDVRHTHAHA